MGKIQLLDSETINQIAAGEVIEHPASVIKELVENSIDAGATKLFIEIENGGQERIVIKDNGCGMNNEDAYLCLQRHATSKIRSHDDLSKLFTMGFRGEALAAIASISHLTLITAEGVSETALQTGVELRVEAGAISSCKEVQTFRGTEITVRSLFYNVPARKKFQKAPSKDAQECLKCITQLALAHPHIAFEFISDKKKELQVKPGTLEARIQALLPHEYTASMKRVYREKDGTVIEGFIGDTSTTKLNRSSQFIFLNQRPIQSLALSFAVKEGYGTMIDKERHPVFVMHIRLQGDNVDVNVHPQKKEVRFRHEEELKRMVIHSVSETLFSTSPSFAPLSYAPSPSPFSFPSPHAAFSFEPTSLPFENREVKEKESDRCLPFTTFHIVGTFQEFIFAEIAFDAAAPEKLRCQGLSIVDARAALCRISFEELSAKSKTQTHSQLLVNPLCITLPLHETKALLLISQTLKNVGFEIREFGASQCIVEAIPADFEISQVEPFLQECLQSYCEEGEENHLKRLRTLSSFLGRHTLLTKNALSIDLAKEIVKRLLACQMPYKCPQGNNIFAIMTKDDLKKELQW